MDKPVKSTFLIDLKSEPFANIAYRMSGPDSHLRHIHSHDGGFEIMQIWSNKGHVLIDGHIYPMKEGAIYLVNGLESHSTNPADDNEYIRNKITFSPNYVRNILEDMEMPHLLDIFSSWISTRRIFFMFSDEAASLIDRIFMEINSEFINKRQGYMAYISSSLIQILILIHRYSDTNMYAVSNYPGHTYIHSMTSYIDRNLQFFDLDTMCKEIPISKYYACHLFKRITGLTLMEYVKDTRISRAKKILITTDKSVSQIAMDCGFSSVTLFCRVFKKVTNLSPLKYRKLFLK